MRISHSMRLSTLSFVLGVIVLALASAWAVESSAQDERRPCVAPGSPKGCVGFTPGQRPQRNAVSTDPDNPGVVPLNDSPLAKAARTPDEWVPPADWNRGTVTVGPVPGADGTAQQPEQSPTAKPDPAQPPPQP